MSEPMFRVIQTDNGIIKAWDHGVPFEEKAIQQLKNVIAMPFVAPYIAAMPDTHWGMGCTVGSVVPTVGAIMPAAVGVDIGCGMMAVLTNARRENFENCLPDIRCRIERVVPHGRTNNGQENDRGAWHNVPEMIQSLFDTQFKERYVDLCERHPGARSCNAARQLGTLGTGNHFIEVCLDPEERVWVVLHSGSRGLGNRIGSYFTELAKRKCEAWMIQLPDPDLAYLPKATQEYGDYVGALHLAQRFAWVNREVMMAQIISELSLVVKDTVHCHHNFMAKEHHHGRDVLLTRKGAVRAGVDDKVIIPGSMGNHTYICQGQGSTHSFQSCSHGAGRAMGRKEAERRFTVEDHIKATEGVECHKGKEVIDETPAAYKNIEAVMAAQSDLVEPIYVLRQIVNVKGWEK